MPSLEGCQALYCKQKADCHILRQLTVLQEIRPQIGERLFGISTRQKAQETVLWQCPNKTPAFPRKNPNS